MTEPLTDFEKRVLRASIKLRIAALANPESTIKRRPGTDIQKIIDAHVSIANKLELGL